jgi:hypothetical protein
MQAAGAMRAEMRKVAELANGNLKRWGLSEDRESDAREGPQTGRAP